MENPITPCLRHPKVKTKTPGIRNITGSVPIALISAGHLRSKLIRTQSVTRSIDELESSQNHPLIIKSRGTHLRLQPIATMNIVMSTPKDAI